MDTNCSDTLMHRAGAQRALRWGLGLLLAAPLSAGVAMAQPSSPPSATPAPPGPPPPPAPTPPEQIAPPAAGPTGSSPIGQGATGQETGDVGVIRPPGGVDPAIRAPAPATTQDTMPVIPPPGTPGGSQRVQPK